MAVEAMYQIKCDGCGGYYGDMAGGEFTVKQCSTWDEMLRLAEKRGWKRLLRQYLCGRCVVDREKEFEVK